jgi:hypothetical protein
MLMKESIHFSRATHAQPISLQAAGRHTLAWRCCIVFAMEEKTLRVTGELGGEGGLVVASCADEERVGDMKEGRVSGSDAGEQHTTGVERGEENLFVIVDGLPCAPREFVLEWLEVRARSRGIEWVRVLIVVVLGGGVRRLFGSRSMVRLGRAISREAEDREDDAGGGPGREPSTEVSTRLTEGGFSSSTEGSRSDAAGASEAGGGGMSEGGEEASTRVGVAGPSEQISGDGAEAVSI